MDLKELLFLKAMKGGGGGYVQATATGNPLTFNTDVAKPLKSLLIPWTPSQSGSGDPSPENVRPISGVSGVTVYHSGADTSNPDTIPVTFPALGKNLFDVESGENGGIDSSGVETPTSDNFRSDYMPITPGEKYTISATGTTIIRMYFFDADKTFISPRETTNSASLTRTAPSNAYFARIVVVVTGVTVTKEVAKTLSIQFEHSASATAYEPYTNTVYGGSLDLTTGVLTVEWGIVTLNGSEQWETYTSPTYGTTYYVINNNKKKAPQSSICDKLKNINACYGASGVGVYGVYSDHESLARWYFRAPDSSITTLEEFTDWLEENPVQIAYKLATTYTVQLTPQQINALVGDNVIWSDTNGTNTVVYLKRG